MKRWYYHFLGCPYAYGPTTNKYRTEKEARGAIREAREAIRKAWNLKKLPKGTEVWPAGSLDVNSWTTK